MNTLVLQKGGAYAEDFAADLDELIAVARHKGIADEDLAAQLREAPRHWCRSAGSSSKIARRQELSCANHRVFLLSSIRVNYPA